MYGKWQKNGSEYEVNTPLTPGTWFNVLYNDEYYLQISQTLQGEGNLVENYVREKTLLGERYFYIKDRNTGEVWNPGYVPMAIMPDRYRCVHGVWYSGLCSCRKEIEARIKVFVPPAGSREIWTVTLHNQSGVRRNISLYSMFGFYDHGVMGGECDYDPNSHAIVKYAVPYHVFYEDYESTKKKKAYLYVLPHREPTSFASSRQRFFGNRDVSLVPEGIAGDRLDPVKGEAEEFCGAFEFEMHLEPGQEVRICLEAGAASGMEEIRDRSKVFDPAYVEELEEKTARHWEECLSGFTLQTPDENLNAFGNYWLKKQIICLTRHNRGGTYCPVRNQLQDAMGYAMVDPEKAQQYYMDVFRLQKRNGYIKQWYDTAGAPPRALCLLNHTDGPVWLAICGETWVRQMGDRNLLDLQIPYQDGGSGSLLQHMTGALLYQAECLGERGLCLMGDGDWNDPINGAGREGKGESVWLSMAFIYAVNRLLPYLEGVDEDAFSRLKQSAGQMKEAINSHAWCEKWYAAAICDDGSRLGDEKDRLFLNTQSWAILSGVADADRKERILESVEQILGTPFGPLLLYPPFMSWDGRWGRISVKKAGTTENGSVYCHASMFYAYAQAMSGDGDGLYDTIKRTLPTNPDNPPEHNRQNPIYLSNYYYGLRDSANFGRSSCHYGTGTVGWMLMLLLEEMLGVRASVDGLQVRPCLPASWKEASCTRKYKNAVYDIHIVKGPSEGVLVDGMVCDEPYLPYEDGRTYRVEVKIR